MAISGTTFGPELLVELDRAAPEPLHRQLANGLRDAIRTGRLAPATRLPSTRVLAADPRPPSPSGGRIQPVGRLRVAAGETRVRHAGGGRPRRWRSAARRRRSCDLVRHRLRARLTGSRRGFRGMPLATGAAARPHRDRVSPIRLCRTAGAALCTRRSGATTRGALAASTGIECAADSPPLRRVQRAAPAVRHSRMRATRSR